MQLQGSSLILNRIVGAGKTHTFFGPDDALFDFDPNDESSFPSSMGLVLRASLEILNAKKSLECRGVSMVISAQFIEIYEERVEDLLSTNNNGYAVFMLSKYTTVTPEFLSTIVHAFAYGLC